MPRRFVTLELNSNISKIIYIYYIIFILFYKQIFSINVIVNRINLKEFLWKKILRFEMRSIYSIYCFFRICVYIWYKRILRVRRSFYKCNFISTRIHVFNQADKYFKRRLLDETLIDESRLESHVIRRIVVQFLEMRARTDNR